jgi:hypothetical protein
MKTVSRRSSVETAGFGVKKYYETPWNWGIMADGFGLNRSCWTQVMWSETEHVQAAASNSSYEVLVIAGVKTWGACPFAVSCKRLHSVRECWLHCIGRYACLRAFYMPYVSARAQFYGTGQTFANTQTLRRADQYLNSGLSFFFLFVFGAAAPHWARASSFTRFLYHTQGRTTVGRTLLDEW